MKCYRNILNILIINTTLIKAKYYRNTQQEVEATTPISPSEQERTSHQPEEERTIPPHIRRMFQARNKNQVCYLFKAGITKK